LAAYESCNVNFAHFQQQRSETLPVGVASTAFEKGMKESFSCTGDIHKKNELQSERSMEV
jgi:hypothetical protein